MSLKACQECRSQSGMGYIGFILILSVSVFIGMFAIKVFPHYYQHWTVEKVTEDLVANPEVLRQSRSKVYSHINQAYRTNNLWDLTAEDTIELERDSRKGHLVRVKYERRDTLFSNIDIVTTFDEAAN